MNKPKFLIRISNRTPACLGLELLDILNVIHPFIKSFIWYGADVQINGKLPYKLALENSFPQKIGHIDALMQLVQKTDQFLSGVFFALTTDLGNVWNQQFFTEDEPFRDIEEAVLEIRAFDTTCFEVYTNNLVMIRTLSDFFHVEIQCQESQSDGS